MIFSHQNAYSILKYQQVQNEPILLHNKIKNIFQNNDNIEENSVFYCTQITLNRKTFTLFLENPLMLPSMAYICKGSLIQIFGIKKYLKLTTA